MKREHYQGRLPGAIQSTPDFVRGMGLWNKLRKLRLPNVDIKSVAKSSVKWLTTGAGVTAAGALSDDSYLGYLLDLEFDQYTKLINGLGLTSPF